MARERKNGDKLRIYRGIKAKGEIAVRKASDGLVIRECPTGESDKLLTVLTADSGKLLINAKGVRSIRSKNTALCRMFTYANFEYYEKNGRYWLAQGSVNDTFFGLNSDIEGLALASYVMELTNEISGEGVADTELLRTALNTLYAIEKKLKPLNLIKGAFEFFAAAHSGFAPELSGCEECGERKKKELYLDVMNGSLLCSDCLKKRSLLYADGIPETDAYATKNILLPLTQEVMMAISYVINSPLQKIFSFNLSNEKDINDLSRAGEIYLQNHLERGFETLNFYHSITKRSI